MNFSNKSYSILPSELLYSPKNILEITGDEKKHIDIEPIDNIYWNLSSNNTIYVSYAKDRDLFKSLVKKWHEERGATSSITIILLCPAYQQIIGMGEKAIPLIIQQLKDEGNNPDHWFWALKAITRKDPVPKESRGKMLEMAKIWIDLAQKEGLV